jgi:hypothetical protein
MTEITRGAQNKYLLFDPYRNTVRRAVSNSDSVIVATEVVEFVLIK